MKAVHSSSKFFRFSFSRLRRRFVVLMVLCLWLVLSLSGWSVAQETKPTPQEWQINGILAALNDDQVLVQADALNRLNEYKPERIKLLLKNPNEVAKIANQILSLKDPEQFGLNVIAITTILQLGEVGKPYFKSAFDSLKKHLITESFSDFTSDYIFSKIYNVGESAKLFTNEVKPLITDPSLSMSNHILLAGILVSTKETEGFFTKDFTESIDRSLKDDSISLTTRCNIAKSISRLGNLATPYIKDILNLFSYVDSVSDDYKCYGVLSSLRNLGEPIKPFTKEVAIFLRSKNSASRLGATQILVSLGDSAKPFIKDILDSILDKTLTNPGYIQNSGKALKLLPKLGNELMKPYINDVLGILQDSSLSISLRSAAASVLADLGLIQLYKDDVKKLISTIASLVRQESLEDNISGDINLALGNFGKAGKLFVKDIAMLLKPENSKKIKTRVFAAKALADIEFLSSPYVNDVISILKDKSSNVYDVYGRGESAEALWRISQIDLAGTVTVLENFYDASTTVAGFSDQGVIIVNGWRSFAYLLSGGSEEVKTLLRWIAKPKSRPTSLTYEEGKKTLELFEKVWLLSEDLPKIREDLAQQIARVTKMVSWQTSDTLLLEKHYQNLLNGNYDNADSVKFAINALEFWQWFHRFRNVIFTHFVFWVSLIFIYPNSPQVQAIFFWNPWVRRILGFGYVGFFLTWIPFLRDRLLAPFRASLIADAGLQNLPAAQAYFPHSEVIPKNGSDRQPLANLKGQMILEGESGLGKTMFLCHLVKNSKRNIVYLTAKRCEKGVIEAIQAKLLLGDTVETSFLKDKHFLRNLIYSGAIDVCIDGLNEVTADTRAKITQFVEQNFKGNILLTTQPMIDWNPPGTASIYTLQPLRPDQIQQFLLSRPLPKDAKQQGDTYKNACAEFLSKFNLGTSTSGHPNLPVEELAAVQRILSNPMDLSIIAQMIAIGENPDLFNLQKQQYKIMAADYEKKKLREFPQKKFAEVVYQMRLADQEVIPADTYEEELSIMEHHKMVVRQWREDSQTKQEEYLFRHDKIMEYFIVQTFLGNSPEVNDRLNTHKSDPRFRGVYFLLATLLPLDAAQNLREDLIQHAADTKDHSVSDTFIQLLRSRSLVNN